MPRFKSVFRIIFGLALGAAYLYVPGLAKKDVKSPVAIDLTAVDAVTLAGLAKGDAAAVRTPNGEWSLKRDPRIAADRRQIVALLTSLAHARFTPAAGGKFPAKPLALVLQANGRQTAIELGPRLAPYRRQLVRLAGETWEVDRDLSACIDLWQGKAGPSVANLAEPAIHWSPDAVVAIEQHNPFASYKLERTAASSMKVVTEEASERMWEWRLTSPRAEPAPDTRRLHRLETKLQRLETRSPAEPQLARQHPMIFRVAWRTEGGGAYALAASGPINDDKDHLVRLTRPQEGPLYVMGEKAFANTVKRGGQILAAMPTVRPPTADAVEVTVERSGRSYTLKRQGAKKWAMTQPAVPYPIFTPPAGPGEKPTSTAQAYVDRMTFFSTAELFDANSPAGKKLAATAFKRPLARALATLPGGKRIELLASQEIAGTGLCLLRVGNRVAPVYARQAVEVLAPEIESFFDPEKLGGSKIKW